MTERHDHISGSGSTFVLGALAGALVGAGIGMLFAPKTGSAVRSQISERIGTMASQAQSAYREARAHASPLVEAGRTAAGKWAEHGEDTYNEARDVTSRIAGQM